MKTINNTLNLKRLAMTIRKDFGENRQKLLLYMGVIFGVALLMCAFKAYNFLYEAQLMYENGTLNIIANHNGAVLAEDSIYYYTDYHNSILLTSGFYLLGVCSIAASKAFGSAGSKQAMLHCITTPASQTEKFISAWLIYVPGVALFTFLSWAVVQYIIYFFVAIASPYGTFFKPQYFNLIFNYESVSAFMKSSIANMTFVIMLFQSVYFLGSTIWPKNAATKTTVFGSIISVLSVILFTLSIKNVASHIANINFDIPYANEIPYIIIATIIAINYILAYMRYHEWEIANKW